MQLGYCTCAAEYRTVYWYRRACHCATWHAVRALAGGVMECTSKQHGGLLSVGSTVRF